MTYDPQRTQPTPPLPPPPQPGQPYTYPGAPTLIPPTRPPTPRKTNWMIVALAAGGAVVLGSLGVAVAAASPDADQPDRPTIGERDEPAAPVLDEPVRDAEYDNVGQLGDAVEDAGYRCDTFEVISDPAGALERAECTSSVTLGIYADQDEAWASVETVHTLMDGLGGLSVHVVGPNWTVNCGDDEQLCRDLQKELGGALDVSEPEPDLTVAQQQAIGSAEDYLAYTAFSRQGLIGQLEYEGFSTEDAEFAVDYLDADWNEQAAKMAEQYLEYSHFSREGLIDQLEYEGFTTEQAEHGVEQVGL
jgi:hypothetical protein